MDMTFFARCYQYILSLSKHENMFYEEKKTQQQKDQKKEKKPFPTARVEPQTSEVEG